MGLWGVGQPSGGKVLLTPPSTQNLRVLDSRLVFSVEIRPGTPGILAVDLSTPGERGDEKGRTLGHDQLQPPVRSCFPYGNPGRVNNPNVLGNCPKKLSVLLLKDNFIVIYLLCKIDIFIINLDKNANECHRETARHMT